MARRLLVPAVLVGTLVACGGGDEDDATPISDTPETTAAADDRSAAATTAPDGADGADVPAALQFTAPLVGGGEIEMATLAGRPVLLWFWAPW